MFKNNTLLPLIILFAFVILPFDLSAQSWQVGVRTITFTDADRSNRSIPCEVYYPADVGGQNVPMAEGEFPHVVFGHGFVMNVGAYSSIAESLAAQGFIVLLVNTETGFSPSHTNFARDLAFVADDVITRSEIPGNFFYEQINGKFAIGGHSMGGGCTYLSVQYLNNDAACLFTFAAAETNPSAIAQMPALATPNLILAGELDCVTPPEDHQIPMYLAQSADDCKFYVEIEGGYHCQFNDFNFNCNLGEGFCSPSGGLSRAAQIQLVLEVLTPWLKSFLFQDCDSWDEFLNLINQEDGIATEFECSIEIPAQPGILVSGIQPACPGDELFLEALEIDGEILWSTGETGSSIVVTAGGIYSYSLSSAVCQIESEAVEIVFQEDPGFVVQSSDGNELCAGENMELTGFPQVGNLSWSTGESGASIIIDEGGIFSFSADLNGCTFQSSEFFVELIVDPNFEVLAPFGNIICSGESVFLEVSDFFIQVLWNNGQSQPVIEVQEAGIYFYEGILGNCIFNSDTLEVFIEELQDLEILVVGETDLCPGDSTLLIAETQNEVFWSTNETNDAIIVTAGGIYFYSVFTDNCVFVSESVEIEIREDIRPLVLLEGGPFFCPGDTATLKSSMVSADILWNTGSSDTIISITENGDYYFFLTEDGCTFFSDTVNVQFTEDPGLRVLTDNGTELCEGDSLVLRPSTPGLEVFWSTADVSDSLIVVDAGLFYFTSGDSNCLFFSDTMEVRMVAIPEYVFIADQLEDICSGDSIVVMVEVSGAEVIWGGLEMSDSLWIFESGSYFFNLLVNGCEFPGEQFDVRFRDSWEIEEIEGPDTVKTGESYFFEIDFFDFLNYDWKVEGAEIISGLFTSRIELFIPEDAEGVIELSVIVSDRGCSEISLYKELVLDSVFTGTYALEDFTYTLFDDGFNLWVRFSRPLVNAEIFLMDSGGKLIDSRNYQTVSEFPILKERFLSGIYFLIIESGGNNLKTLKLPLLR